MAARLSSVLACVVKVPIDNDPCIFQNQRHLSIYHYAVPAAFLGADPWKGQRSELVVYTHCKVFSTRDLVVAPNQAFYYHDLYVSGLPFLLVAGTHAEALAVYTCFVGISDVMYSSLERLLNPIVAYLVWLFLEVCCRNLNG